MIDLTVTREQLPSVINVGFFCFFVLCYLFILFAFGFWVASPLLLWVSITYFNPDKSALSFAKSLLISLVACGVAYVVFTYIFYVPFPQSRLFGWRLLKHDCCPIHNPDMRIMHNCIVKFVIKPYIVR